MSRSSPSHGRGWPPQQEKLPSIAKSCPRFQRIAARLSRNSLGTGAASGRIDSSPRAVAALPWRHRSVVTATSRCSMPELLQMLSTRA